MAKKDRIVIPECFNTHHDFEHEHPNTGNRFWGEVQVTSRLLGQPGGNIVLRSGRHFGPHRGFGIRHIWLERGHDLQKWGYETIYDVPRFVSDIIKHGSNIVCEFNSIGNYQRLIVMKGRNGCAVLEICSRTMNHTNEALYSVVTAYRGRNPQGQSVARVIT